MSSVSIGSPVILQIYANFVANYLPVTKYIPVGLYDVAALFTPDVSNSIACIIHIAHKQINTSIGKILYSHKRMLSPYNNPIAFYAAAAWQHIAAGKTA
jgi:hypothetical protein